MPRRQSGRGIPLLSNQRLAYRRWVPAGGGGAEARPAGFDCGGGGATERAPGTGGAIERAGPPGTPGAFAFGLA